MPIQVPQSKWLSEAMMNLNKPSVTNTNEESLNMPSMPTFLNNEVFHYYVDVGGVEEHIVSNEEQVEEDSAIESKFPVDP